MRGLLFAACWLCSCAPAERAEVPDAPPAAPAPLVVTPETEAWEYNGRSGRRLSTAHYKIHTTVNNPTLVGRAPAFMEHALAHYRGMLTPLPEPAAPMDSYIFADRNEWVRGTAELLGDRAAPLLGIRRGGFATRGTALLWDIGIQDTFAIAAHEGWHQYTQSTFRDRLPPVLEEAMAAYAEGFRWDPRNSRTPVFLPWANIERFDNLRDAASEGDLFILDELLATAPGELVNLPGDRVITYYAQGWALIHFLAEGEGGKYRPQLEALLSDTANGRLRQRLASKLGDWGDARMLRSPGRAIFAAYFGREFFAIDREYRAFIDRITAPGAKTQISQGRSPL